MRNKWLKCKFLLLALFLMAVSTRSLASHLAASDIFVDYIGLVDGDLRYKVTVIVYRACDVGSINMNNPQSVQITSSCTAVPITIFPDTTGTGSGQEQDQLCPNFSAINSCTTPGSPWPGFQKYVFIDTVTLPQKCSDWTFTWTNGGRNSSILNINNGTNITISCQINNVFRYDQSSPRFNVDPIPYLCVNQPATFFNGPSDKNADSIETLNKQPQGCGGGAACDPAFTTGEIAYMPGYSFANPIASTSGYSVYPATGTAVFTPSATGKFVLAFRCKKYDPLTGTFLGYADRDVQVSVLNCVSPPPTIDSIPLNVSNGVLRQGNVIITCPNSPLDFDMNAKSTSATNAVYLSMTSLVGTVNGSAFTVTGQGGNAPSGHFTWTPAINDIGNHIIQILATDSSCTASQPIVFKSYLIVTIKVIPGIEVNPRIFKTCPFNVAPITLSVSYYPGFTYSWTKADGSSDGITDPTSLHPQVAPSYNTVYYVDVPGLPTSCISRDSAIVFVDTSTHITISPQGTPTTPIIMCAPGLLHLTANASGFIPYLNLPCGLIDTAQLTKDHDSTDIVPENGSYQFTADPTVTPFNNYHSSRHQYLVMATDMLKSGMFSSSLTGLAFKVSGPNIPGNSYTYDSVSISLKCTTSPFDTSGAFTTGTTQVFFTPALIIPSTPGFFKIKFDRPYNWDTTQNLVVDICFHNRSFNLPATTFFNYYFVGYQATLDGINRTKDICSGVARDSVIKPQYMLPQIMFFYDHAPLAGWSYKWERAYGSNLLSDSTAMSPDLWVSQSSKYLVYTKGRQRCSARDSVYIYLDEHSATINPLDTSICAGRSVLITVNGGKSYKWYQHGFDTTTTLSCLDCAVPVAKPFDSTRYTVVISDSVNCADTLYSNINVLALPVFTTVPRDTTIKYGASIRLHVSNDTLNYVWSPISTLDDPYSSAPVAKPFEPTIYTVVGTLNNCSWTDTVRVGIDYSSNLLVPSVFSPNHDGKNDRFRVAGLTFQKIIEFRVFNRMGQELYNATDNVGWDGTWNNVEQDIDTYFYFIRVAYPDGFIQNFKGDVTLLR